MLCLLSDGCIVLLDCFFNLSYYIKINNYNKWILFIVKNIAYFSSFIK